MRALLLLLPAAFGGNDEGGEDDGGIDGGIEEGVEMVVGEGLPAPFVKLPLAPVVAAENQEGGGGGDPLVLGEQGVDVGSQARLADDDDVALLKIAFRRRAQGGGGEGLDQGLIDGTG